MLKNKTLMITGGTGSFGNAVLKRFLTTDIKEIRIFSRDEKNKMICAGLTETKKSNSISGMSGIRQASNTLFTV